MHSLRVSNDSHDHSVMAFENEIRRQTLVTRTVLRLIPSRHSHLAAQHRAVHATLRDDQLIAQNLTQIRVLVHLGVVQKEFVGGEPTAAVGSAAYVRLLLFEVGDGDDGCLDIRRMSGRNGIGAVHHVFPVVLSVILALKLETFLFRDERGQRLQFLDSLPHLLYLYLLLQIGLA